jgi:hypothetical protein
MAPNGCLVVPKGSPGFYEPVRHDIRSPKIVENDGRRKIVGQGEFTIDSMS